MNNHALSVATHETGVRPPFSTRDVNHFAWANFTDPDPPLALRMLELGTWKWTSRNGTPRNTTAEVEFESDDVVFLRVTPGAWRLRWLPFVL